MNNSNRNLFAETGVMLLKKDLPNKYLYIGIGVVVFGYTPETVTKELRKHIKNTIYFKCYGGR